MITILILSVKYYGVNIIIILQLSNIKHYSGQFLYAFCFLECMVSVQNNSVNNTVNTSPAGSGLHIGVVNPPDKFQKVVLYSDAEATKQFKQLNRDIYAKQKQVSFEETKKTPKSVFYIVGSGILATLGVVWRCVRKKKV